MRTQSMIALVGVAMLGFLGFSINSWSRRETLSCDRDQTRVQCTVTRDAWFSGSASKTYDQVTALKATNFTRTWWAVALTDHRGNEDDVVKEISEDEARRIERWFAQREAHVESARERYPWHLSLLNLVFMLGIAMCIWGFRLERRNRKHAVEEEISPP
jgi:hypothetical protein